MHRIPEAVRKPVRQMTLAKTKTFDYVQRTRSFQYVNHRRRGSLVILMLAVTAGLFFGLFFGLNFPEIIRHGFIHTNCKILSSNVVSRYCCEQGSCQTNTCSSAPSGAQGCSSLISQLDDTFNPTTCAGNSTACPPQSTTCNAGYYCCSQCCDVCQSCHTVCSTSGKHTSCSQSCTNYSCNCRCCRSTNNLECTVSCPTCYAVDLQLSFMTRNRHLESNITYQQDFQQDQASANSFQQKHQADTTTQCYYNPSNISQVLLDVSFTTWKWVITSIFGIVPFFIVICVAVWLFTVMPCLARRAMPSMAPSMLWTRKTGKEKEATEYSESTATREKERGGEGSSES